MPHGRAARRRDSGTGALDQMVVAEYFSKHFDEHVGELSGVLKEKLDTMVEAVEREFGTAAESWKPKGGIFLWMKLPDQVDVRKLVKPARNAGIQFNPGPEWAVNREPAKSYMRLCFGLTTKEEIREGVAALCAGLLRADRHPRAKRQRAARRARLTAVKLPIRGPSAHGLDPRRKPGPINPFELPNNGSRLPPGRAEQEAAMSGRRKSDTDRRGAAPRSREQARCRGSSRWPRTRQGRYMRVRSVGAMSQGPAMTLDTVFRIASMTKAITSVAAMQLVEEGRLSSTRRCRDIDRRSTAPQVLDGFDAAGAPRAAPGEAPDHLKHLLTHTAGFTYECWNAEHERYVEATGTPGAPASSPRCGGRWRSTPASAGSTASISTGSAGWSKRSAANRSTSIFANASSPRSAWAIPVSSTPEQRARQAPVHQRRGRRQARTATAARARAGILGRRRRAALDRRATI